MAVWTKTERIWVVDDDHVIVGERGPIANGLILAGLKFVGFLSAPTWIELRANF